MKHFIEKHRFAIKWLSIALLIKSVLFAFFAWSFCKYWKPEWNEGLFNASGDTSVYYGAVEAFYNGHGYNTYCRMPGLLPIYYPIRLLFNVTLTKNIIIILQFLTGVVSVYVLAKIARLLFNSQRIFLFTFFLYAFSSFVSIWDHVGYADSFGTSFLVFSIYLLVLNKIKPNWKYVLCSGIFLAWSVFFRPVHGIIIPFAVLIYLVNLRDFAGSFKKSFLFILPVALFLGMWTSYNYSKYKKVIVLQGETSDCFQGLTKDLLAIRELIIAWGGDIQPWSRNSEGEWFFDPVPEPRLPEPSSSNIYTSEYNLDSLKNIRKSYVLVHSDSIADSIRAVHSARVVEACNRYLASYKKEHKLGYYITSKLKQIRKFLIPSRLDDLPLPSVDKMSFFQKAIKGGYFLLLILVNVFGFIGSFFILKRKIWLPVIPLVLFFTLCPLMGLIEQRYLVPVYGFFVIGTAYLADKILSFLQARNRKPGTNDKMK